MCIRRAEDGSQFYVICSGCGKVESGGSFDETRFKQYLVEKLGWRRVQVCGRWVRMCPECYEKEV
jgi:hypothetical protein